MAGKQLKGAMPKKLLKKLHETAESDEQKWAGFVGDLLLLAGDDPGKKLPDFDGEKLKRVNLEPKKKIRKAAEKYMEAHKLSRKEVLGYALARGWELSKR